MTHAHLADAIPCQTHRSYRLDCEQYEGLRIESHGMCQICGFPAEEMPQRKLYIDHAWPGRWAVRGLLCIRCNTQLEGGVAFSSAAAAYLGNAWYVRQCAAFGVPVDGGPEPDARTVVDNFGRRWTRRYGRWHPNIYRARPRPWFALNMTCGPFNLRAVK
ncbi:hypothetical protein BJF79_13720 [Actinomadura sp. CNU-125]|uniref:endonuclease domain-containing protein n=1 Tax=Actinomadura sp. CNU-125 TaxID=1904961 RepID=UPI00096183BF|nr:endonuclease domain-containing protein [Actinomadura sp. CNU-125]OLT24395.1 hypothetical protein BJF79_13720 [Actinomadura sp. CNU-125]